MGVVGWWWWWVGCLGGGSTGPESAPLVVDHGVDPAVRRIRIGALNDESGPAKSIGHPFALGKRVLVARANAGGTGWLPEGWTLELVERDHAYSPAEARRGLAEIADDVLFVTTSFGTEHTLAIRDGLQAADLVAFPASLSTALHGNPLTPVLGASYEAEARRAVDYHVVEADGRPIKLAVVHQPDAYGGDVARGATAAAATYGLGEPLLLPARNPEEASALGARLASEAITHVVLGTLPPLTLALLEDSRARKSAVVWVGATPSWSDAFARRPDGLELLASYRQTSSLPWWGEDLPGMDGFESAFAEYGGGEPADGYVLMSYAMGMVQLEAVGRAIEAGDVTR
ncbi:MAG: ABC transporter substrate-binding protein, partial [Myxococcota bacterium]